MVLGMSSHRRPAGAVPGKGPRSPGAGRATTAPRGRVARGRVALVKFHPLSERLRRFAAHSPVAQRQSIRLLIEGLLVRIQPGERS